LFEEAFTGTELIANCILLHSYSRMLRFPAARAQTKTYSLFTRFW